MMSFVATFATIGLCEPNLTVFDAIDSSDMNAVGANYFHLSLYPSIGHFIYPRSWVEVVNAVGDWADAFSSMRCDIKFSSAALEYAAACPTSSRRFSLTAAIRSSIAAMFGKNFSQGGLLSEHVSAEHV